MSTTPDANRERFEEFYFTCIEDAFEEVDIYGDAEKFAEGLQGFAEWVGDLLCVHWLMAEYQNGGLMQFFINSTGILAPEAVVALRRMRWSAAAEALNRAVELFGAPYPRDKKDRYQILRTKAGLEFEDMEKMMWRARLFKNMEDQLSAVGSRNIYERMNEYAKEYADEI